MQVLAELLDGLRMYGRERQVEDILQVLDLPAMHPSTLVLVGPPESCPSRFFASFTRLLVGLPLPVAQVICTPTPWETPNGLLLALLTDFFQVYPRKRLKELIAPLLQAHRWLAWYFPVLRDTTGTPPPPPDDTTGINRVLETVLHTIVHTQPHLAIIHHLHTADAESLATLQALQVMNQQGLRLLASADPVQGRHYPAWSTFFAGAPAPITLLPFTPIKLREYLAEITPELTSYEVVEHLFRVSVGQPLTVETLLRAWVLDGVLTRNCAGWCMTPLVNTKGRVEFMGISPALEAVLDYLAQAALVGSTSRSFLSMLWRISPEETASVISYGRLLGYLAAPSPEDPECVDFVDLDHQDSLLGRLTLEQRGQIHRVIVTLMEEKAFRQQRQSAASPRINLPRGTGQEQPSDSFLTAIRQEVRKQSPEANSPESLFDLCRFTWRIEAPYETDEHVLSLIIEAVHAIRLAAIQCRLYPPNSRPIIEYTDVAVTALNRLFTERSSLTITSDGDTLAFDGNIITGTDILTSCQDYRRWMTAGHLQAIGFTRGVHTKELMRFLTVLVTHESIEGYQAFLDKIAGQHLIFIQIFSWHHLLTTPEGYDARYAGMQPVFTHRGILDFLVGGGDILMESDARERGNILPVASPEVTDASSYEDDFLITGENVRELPARLAASSPAVRRELLANLQQWVCDQQDEILLGQVDEIVCNRLSGEDDLTVLTETMYLAGLRMHTLLENGQLAEVLHYLQVANARYARETQPLVHRAMADLLAHISNGTAYATLLDQVNIDAQEDGKRLRELTDLLGEYAIRPLLIRLQQQARVQDTHLLHLWSLIGKRQQAVLCKELRTEQPWYYYRNLLLVLAIIGTTESLGAISEKCAHAHPLVRLEALTAAAAIAASRALPYILHALTDSDVQVCTLAVTLAGRYPHPRLLHPLLTILSPARRTTDNESIQLAACAALGNYAESEARTALLRMLHPPLLTFSPKPSTALRCTALAALTPMHADHAVYKAIQRARTDPEPTIRIAAERAWQLIDAG